MIYCRKISERKDGNQQPLKMRLSWWARIDCSAETGTLQTILYRLRSADDERCTQFINGIGKLDCDQLLNLSSVLLPKENRHSMRCCIVDCQCLGTTDWYHNYLKTGSGGLASAGGKAVFTTENKRVQEQANCDSTTVFQAAWDEICPRNGFKHTSSSFAFEEECVQAYTPWLHEN